MRSFVFKPLLGIVSVLLATLVFSSCRGDEPDEEGLFHLTLGMRAPAEVAMGIHSAEVFINGEQKDIEVTAVGSYDKLTVSEHVPDGVTLQVFEKRFIISVPVNSGSEPRTVRVDFSVSKGRDTQNGYVTVIQQPITAADYKKKEVEAIKKYLRKFDVVEQLPQLADIQEGPVAPFYRLNDEGTAYMQVVRKGSGPVATTGEQIYFRFNRYNLLKYMDDGVLPPAQGNWSDMVPVATSFVLGSNDGPSAAYGTAIQMPLLLGLPVDSEVNLLVASSAGFAADAATYTPYLYTVRYYTALN